MYSRRFIAVLKVHNSYYYDKMRKRENLQESTEIGNDVNKIVTIETINSIFQEIFKQQEQGLIETKSASTLTNDRIDELSADITKNNEKLIIQEVTDVQVSIDASQQIKEEKMEALEQNFEKEKKRSLII